jgi:predicted nucleic acid-binding protein
MSGDSFLLDTNTVLYLLNGDDALTHLLQDKNIFISVITEMELLCWPGLEEHSSINKIKKVLEEFTIIGLENEVKEIAIEFRRKYKLKLPDAIILATANFLNLPLITGDKKLVVENAGSIVLYKSSLK